jgi:hypothetical protein
MEYKHSYRSCMKYGLLVNSLLVSNHTNSSQKKIMIVTGKTIVYNIFTTPETKIITCLLSESYCH